MKKMAILFAGGVNAQYSYTRYENDLKLAYTVLRDKWGFNENDIFIFLGYGKPIEYNGNKILTKIALKRLLLESFKSIADELTKDDCFVFIVSNHGTEHAYINMWGNDLLGINEFETYINEIKANKLIVMGQCFGGDFLRLKLSNTCMITANEPGKITYVRLLDRNYDEFLYLFFSYLCKKDDNLEQENNSKLSQIDQAFNFSFENDQYNPNGRCYKQYKMTNNEYMIEIPQMKNNIADLDCFI